jgi:hypothetical protein
MKDPIKIIHKIKNNNRKIIYKVYIFIGPLVSNKIKKILESITDLDFFTTLNEIKKADYIELEKYYGEFWYEYFFLSYHLENQKLNIDNSNEKKNQLINIYGKEWFSKHIQSNKIIYKNINYTFASQYYNYMLLHNKIRSVKEKTVDFRTYKPDYQNQKGGDLEDEDNIIDENEKIEDNDLTESKIIELNNDLDYTNIDLEAIEKIYLTENIQDTKTIKETTELLNKALNDYSWGNNIQKLGLEYDEEDENIIYDMILQDVTKKYYITDQYIFKDETIKNIKQKIAYSINISKKFVSNPNRNLKLIPETQYLWSDYKILKNKKNINEQVMLGQKWIRRNELINIDIIPNENIVVYEKVKNNLIYLKNNIEYKIKRDDDENNILSSYSDFITNNEIFLLDIYNDLGIGYNTSGENKINLFDIYVNIYFHYISSDHLNQIIDFLNNIELDNNKELSYNELVFNSLVPDVKLESEIEKTVEELKLLMETNLFDINFYENYIIHCNIHININNPQNLTGTGIENKFNLYRIFDNFVIDEKYPFIHIQTLKTEATRKFYLKFNDKELLTKWFETSPNGIAVKILINPTKYLTIIIHETGKIEYTIIWKEEDNATIKDIEDTFTHVKDLIKKINSENKKIKIIIPTNDQFNYGFMNSIQKFSIPNDFKINHDDLSDLSRYFFNYVALVIDPKKRESLKKNINYQEVSKYGTYLRYKRVNKYDNKLKMYMKILYYMKNYEITNNELINIISRQFNITFEEASREFEHVKNKYSKIINQRKKKLKHVKLIPKIKPLGVGIDIQGRDKENYKIRITGSKNKEQLNNILDFIKILIYLYTNIYLYKNKDYQNIKEILKGLHKVARRRNKVSNFALYEESKKEIKTISKLDKERLGYTPDKGQNQYSRLCQNSGKKKRRPEVIPEVHIEKLLENGYKFNKETKFYEKEVQIKIKNKIYKSIIKAIKLPGSNSTYNYYTCDPSQNNEYIHIGFLTKGVNPNNLCMPCCFKKDFMKTTNQEKKNYYLKCINEKIKENEDNFINIGINDKIYILRDTDKIQNNKFIFLPKYLNIVFNKIWNNDYKIKNHYLYESLTGYFFKYTIKNDKYYFLSVISNIYNLTITDIINKIIIFLEKDKDDKIFRYLENGNLSLKFSNKKENYINFIKSKELLEYYQIGEIIAIPGVICSQGINFFIFNKNKIYISNKNNFEKEEVKEDYYLDCLNKENYKNYYENKDFIFLIKDEKYFSPIFKIIKNKNKLILDKIFTIKDKIVSEIKKYYEQSCNNNIINNLFLERKLFTKNIIDNLETKKQIIDENNKCIFIETNNGLYIPVYPSGISYKYPFKMLTKLSFLDYKTTIKLLDKINKDYNYIPKTVYYDKKIDTKNNIVRIYSILLENNLIIPIKVENESETNIKKLGLSLFFEASEEIINEAIINKTIDPNDKRIINVKVFNYNKEAYNLYRLELSYYLSKNQEIKKQIINIVRSTKDKMTKQNELRNILFNIIFKKIGTIINNLIDLKNYNINNIRNICSDYKDSNKCNENLHCTWNKGICSFQLTENMLITYVNKVIEECIQDNIKFKEIIEENEYYVSDIVNNTYYIQRENQKIYTSSNLNIKKIMEELLGKSKLLFSQKNNQRDIIVSPLIESRNEYIQEIISNSDSVIRAYINCYYWINNPLYDIEVRNLGYINEFQTQLTYLFKAYIIDYMETKLKLDIKEVQKFRNSSLNTNGKTELLILSHLLNTPIKVLDTQSSIKYLFLQGEIPVNKNTIEKFNNIKNIITIKFEFDNKKIIPSKIFVVYKK